MSDTASQPKLSEDTSGYTLAFLVLRLWLGVRALISGIEKFSATVAVQKPLLDASGNPDPSGAIVEIDQKVYGFANYQGVPDALKEKFLAEPMLPSFLTTPFYATLGYVLIALGLMLIVGLFTRISLFAMGIVYVMLTVGLILIKQDVGVSSLAVHIALVAFALVLSRYNRFAVTRR
ncbi:MAG TPA: hypothetical protein VNB29_07745 [Chthoniobacterales bacterium]|nr:hypothetical protein [Chthoniobacterales bacterium]